MTSPWNTIARRLPPASPVTTSPACSAARSFGTVPNSRSNSGAARASAASMANRQASGRAAARPAGTSQVTTISSPTYWYTSPPWSSIGSEASSKMRFR